jgi:hypothetical protein
VIPEGDLAFSPACGLFWQYARGAPFVPLNCFGQFVPAAVI